MKGLPKHFFCFLLSNFQDGIKVLGKPKRYLTPFVLSNFQDGIIVLGKPKLVIFAVFFSLLVTPAFLLPSSVMAEDFTDDEFVDEEVDNNTEETDTVTPTPSPTAAPTETPTPTPTPTPTNSEEEGEVLAGATELGDTGGEFIVYILAGLVGMVVVAAGFKIAHSNAEE